MKRTKLLMVLGVLLSLSITACNSGKTSDSNSNGDVSSEAESKSEKEHVHNYSLKNTDAKYLASEADCTNPARYYYSCECGEAWTETFTYGEALGHSWHQEVSAKYLAQAATCQSRAFYYLSCERCGEASNETFGVGDPSNHNFTKVVVNDETLVSAATCTAPAYYYLSCEDCGEIDHEHTISVGDSLGHNWDEVADTMFLDKAATCLDKAVYHVSCTRCKEMHETRTFEYGSPLGHSFTNYVGNNDATCTENGTETAPCDHAGCDVTDTREVANSMLEHTLDAEALPQYLKTAATCTEDAVYYKHCENCDFISEETFENIGTKLGHTYNPITGSCINECGETRALQETIDFGDGSFKNIESSAVIDFAERNKEFIFDFELKGNENVPTTNIAFRPIHGDTGSAVYYSNLTFVAYNDKGEYINVNRLNTAVYSLEDNFANGSHIYVHAKVIATDYTNFRFEIKTHQYTGLTLVAAKNATCVTPRVQQHIAFDQSETTGTWLESYAREEKAQETFVSGSAGTGHSMTHYAATNATATSPALKEHWYCNKCGGYYLTSEGEEEVEYEALYANTLYGTVQSFYTITGRGPVFKARMIVDNGNSPIESNDARYVGQNVHIILEDASDITALVTDIEVNLHIVDILLRGFAWDDLAAPKAFYFNA